MTLAAITAVAAIAGQWLNLPVQLPGVQSKPLTEVAIIEGISTEQKQRDFIRATLAATWLYEANGCDPWLAERTARYAIATGLPVRIVAADVVVESSCRPNVVSPKGAVGLTQVMPGVWNVTREELLDPDRNLEVGTQVLAGYVHRFGMREGLRHYLGTGATDGSTDGYSYADHVLTVAYQRKAR